MKDHVRRVALCAVAVVVALMAVEPVPTQAAPDVVMWASAKSWPRAVHAGRAITVPVTLTSLKPNANSFFHVEGWCMVKSAPQGRYKFRTKNQRVSTDAKKQGRVTVKLTIPKQCSSPNTTVTGGTRYAFTAAAWLVVGGGSVPVNFFVYAPFTSPFASYNLLARKAPPNPGQNYTAHHLYPQKYQAQLSRVGINVNDPANLTWWCSKAGVPTNLQSGSRTYAQLWDSFFKRTPRPTKKQAITYQLAIQARFTYSC